MKRKKSRKYSRFFFAVIALLFAACKGSDKKDCAVEYKVSQAHFSSYYRTKDSTELILALRSLNDAGNCREYRKRINALKISVLFLLQRYRQVAAFIDSSDAGDFSKPYQKSFSKNFALARNFESEKKLQKRDSLLRLNLGLISVFLRSTAGSRLDTTAVYDYFYIESQFLPREKYLSAVDSAEKNHPGDSALFRAFRGSFYPATPSGQSKK